MQHRIRPSEQNGLCRLKLIDLIDLRPAVVRQTIN
jgi:hypothetical protein